MGHPMTRDISPTGQFSDKILKLLPAEVTAAYLAIRSVIDLVSGNQGATDLVSSYILFAVIIILMALTPVFLSAVRAVTDRRRQWFLSFSFFVWAINIDYSRVILIAPTGTASVLIYVIPILLISWAALALPIFVAQTGA